MAHIQMNGEDTPSEMPLPPVDVPVEFSVISAEMKESQKTGKAMLEVVMEVIGTEAPGERLYDYFVEPTTNKRSQVSLKRLAQAVGVEISSDGFDSEELIGQKGTFTLKHDEYQGQKRCKIAGYVVE